MFSAWIRQVFSRASHHSQRHGSQRRSQLAKVRRRTLLQPRLESLEGRAMLTMLAPVNYSGAAASDVQIADMNADGRPDIVQLNSMYSSVSVMLSNADGTFQPAVSSSSGGLGSSMRIADFNGDGKMDIATNQGSAVDLLMGNGDGSFQLPTPYYVG